jgi:hypothetical protein
MRFIHLFFTLISLLSYGWVAASPIPQGSNFFVPGTLIGTRPGIAAFNSAQASSDAQRASIAQIEQSSWARQNPNAAFGGDVGTW